MKSTLNESAPKPPSIGDSSVNRAWWAGYDDYLTEKLLSAKALSEMLGLSARTVWTLTKQGSIPSLRIGRSVRYRPSEIRVWLRAGAPTEPGSWAAILEAVSE